MAMVEEIEHTNLLEITRDEEEEEEEEEEEMSSQQERVIKSSQPSLLRSTVAMLLWVLPIYLNVALFLTLVLLLALRLVTAALLIAAALIVLVVIPVNEKSTIGGYLASVVGRYGPGHFPVTIHVEDVEAFDQSKSYILAAEPHSVFPVGCISLLSITGLMPLSKTKALASTAVFYTPLFRHITTWMGLVPATKKNFIRYLKAGYSCTIIPGGVKEIIYMNHDYEVAYLKKRYGFVRVAMESGSPLVPVFCFGQCDAYKWWKPGGTWYTNVAKILHFAPLVFWGAYGSPIPYRKPIDIVVGSPIKFKQNPNPSKEEVIEVHGQFLSSLERVFSKYKEKVGHAETQLRII